MGTAAAVLIIYLHVHTILNILNTVCSWDNMGVEIEEWEDMRRVIEPKVYLTI